MKYPHININLGTQENAFEILNICSNAAKFADIEQNVIDAFIIEATSKDYLYLIDTCHLWFNVIKDFQVYRPKEDKPDKERKHKKPKRW